MADCIRIDISFWQPWAKLAGRSKYFFKKNWSQDVILSEQQMSRLEIPLKCRGGEGHCSRSRKCRKNSGCVRRSIIGNLVGHADEPTFISLETLIV